MICREAQRWLLSAEAPQGAPEEVCGHLRGCRKCRRLRRRLLRLEGAVRDVPAPVPSPAARAALLARLEPTAGAAPFSTNGKPEKAAPAPRRGRLALVLRAAAVLLVACLSLWALRPGPSPPAAGPQQPAAPAGGDVLAQAMERHLKLAEGLPAAERLRVLADLAGDLRGESLRQAQTPAPANLPQLARLYRQVLTEGVLPRAGRLPAEQRRQVLRPLADELRRAEGEVQQVARQTAAEAARSLQGLADAAREVRLRLDALLTESAL
jgi:hypothetical protein